MLIEKKKSYFRRLASYLIALKQHDDIDLLDASLKTTGDLIGEDDLAISIKEIVEAVDHLYGLPKPFIPKGVIETSADFPTAESVEPGWTYKVKANVTDDDVTKTNTGLSFLAGDEICWFDDTLTWIGLGSTALFYRNDATDTLSPSTANDNIDLGEGTFKGKHEGDWNGNVIPLIKRQDIFGMMWNKAAPSVPVRTMDAVGMIAGVGLDTAYAYNEFDSAPIFGDMEKVTDTYGNEFIRLYKCYLKKFDGGNFYAKQISKAPFDGCYLPKCFWDFTNNVELPYVDIGCYLSSRDGSGFMESKPNLYPERNLTLAQWRTAAQLNNTGGLLGYQQMDLHTWDVLQALMDIEFATFDIQAIMAGYTAGQYSATHTATADSASNTIIVSNATGALYEIGQHISVGTSLGGFQDFYGRKITNKQVDTPGVGSTTITYDGASVNITTGDILMNSPWLNGFSSVMNASSGGIGNLTNGKWPMMYRGIENMFGSQHSWVDGVNIWGGDTWVTGTLYPVGALVIGWDGAAETTVTWVCTVEHTSTSDTRPTSGADHLTVWANLNGRQAYVCLDPANYAVDTFSGNYVKLGYVNAPTNNFIQEEGYDSNYPFANFPKTVSATATFLRDYYYQYTGRRVALVGGDLGDGARAGPRLWSLSDSSGRAFWHLASRLLKKALSGGLGE